MGTLMHSLAFPLVGLWISTFKHGPETSVFAGLGLVAVFGLLLLFAYESMGRHFHRHQPWDRFR